MRATDIPWWADLGPTERRSNSVFDAFLVLQAASVKPKINEADVCRRAARLLRGKPQ